MGHAEYANNGGIFNAKVVTETGFLENGSVCWKNGVIERVGPMDGFPPRASSDLQWIDANGGWVLPGFIDIHVHGGNGGDFMDADPVVYERIASFHAGHGTTGMLATTVTASPEDIARVLQAAADYRKNDLPYAEVYGVHLEGPFISRKWPGAQNPQYIADPNMQWLDEWIRRYPGLIRIVTLAPEQPGAMEVIRRLTREEIVAACGHTDASYDDISLAADAGLSHAVHTFNAMRGLHHREPGALGAVLTDRRIYAELIADGLHVHPACIRLLLSAKGTGQLILVTDAISAAGLGDGEYRLGGLDVIVRDGAARLKESGALAGSTLTMLDAFRNFVRYAGVPAHEASRMASGNPARRLNLFAQTGSIEQGKQADLLWLDGGLNLLRVWKKGRPVPGAPARNG